jgi:hypothetical protein
MTDVASSAAVGPSWNARIASFLPALSVFVVAVALRIVFHLNTDVSWLLTLSEKVLGGERPYVDFIEVNPPASILLYFPAVALGHVLGVTPESIVNVLVFSGVFASLAFCGRILLSAHMMTADEQPLFAFVALTILLILPFDVFAQREHIAVIAMAPMLCVYAGRASGAGIGAAKAILAGLASGIAIAVKPHFAAALLLPFFGVLVRQKPILRGARSLIFAPENIAAFAVAAMYGGIVFWFFPAFIQNALPIVITLYLPIVTPFFSLLRNPTCLLWVCASGFLAIVAGRRMFSPFVSIAWLASLGFLAAMLIQAKGWPYHGYPAVAMALMAGVVSVRNWCGRCLRFPAPLIAALYVMLCAGAGAWFAVNEDRKELTQAVQADAKQNPKVLAISGDIGLGHPLTRLVHGRWVGSACSLWITTDAEYLIAQGIVDSQTTKRMRQYEILDRAMLLRDLKEGRPDVILIDGAQQRAWATADPAIRTELTAYRIDRAVGGVEIWLRRTRV